MAIMWSRAWTASSRWMCTCRAARHRLTRFCTDSSSSRRRSPTSARRAGATLPARRLTRVLTAAQARALVQERLGVAAGGEGSLLVVETTADRWLEVGRFARKMLGCVYFSFLSAVHWKCLALDGCAGLEGRAAT